MDNKDKGGVEDEGDFREGFCFKLSFLMQGKKTFVVCAEELEVKQAWMEALKKHRANYIPPLT